MADKTRVQRLPPSGIRRVMWERELACHREVQGAHVVRLLGDRTSSDRAFLALEECAGSLKTTVTARDPISVSLPAVLGWLAQVLDGLASLHEAGWVHNDLKHDNVLVRDFTTMDVVVADFGLANRIGKNGLVKGKKVLAGTIGYRSPERLKGNDIDGRSDVWAAGVMAFEALASRTQVFGGATPAQEVKKACAGFTPAMWANPKVAQLPEEVRDLINLLTEPEPSARPSAADAATLTRCVLANVLRAQGQDYPGANTDDIYAAMTNSGSSNSSSVNASSALAPPSPLPATPGLTHGSATSRSSSPGAVTSPAVAAVAGTAVSPSATPSAAVVEAARSRASSVAADNSTCAWPRIIDSGASCTPSLLAWIREGLPPRVDAPAAAEMANAAPAVSLARPFRKVERPRLAPAGTPTPWDTSVPEEWDDIPLDDEQPSQPATVAPVDAEAQNNFWANIKVALGVCARAFLLSTFFSVFLFRFPSRPLYPGLDIPRLFYTSPSTLAIYPDTRHSRRIYPATLAKHQKNVEIENPPQLLSSATFSLASSLHPPRTRHQLLCCRGTTSQ